MRQWQKDGGHKSQKIGGHHISIATYPFCMLSFCKVNAVNWVPRRCFMVPQWEYRDDQKSGPLVLRILFLLFRTTSGLCCLQKLPQPWAHSYGDSCAYESSLTTWFASPSAAFPMTNIPTLREVSLPPNEEQKIWSKSEPTWKFSAGTQVLQNSSLHCQGC